MKYEELNPREIELAANDTEITEVANDSLEAIEIEAEEVVSDDDDAEVSRAIEVAGAIPEIDFAAAAEAQAKAKKKKNRFKIGVSWAALGGGMASLAWIGAAIGGPISYYGFDAVMAMDPAIQAGMLALAFGPSVLFWLASCAAGEAFKARRLASALAEIAETDQREEREPLTANDSEAGRITLSVKNEVLALQDAVSGTLKRLTELEAAAKRNAAMFEGALSATRDNADYMAGNLARERDALIALNDELRGQTDTMANSIGRQIRLMREASKLVRTEIGAAEDALEQHLASFAASASVMADRTSDIRNAAHDVNDANAHLTGTMTNVLDGLSEATKLTDAARQSAHQATLAATETATAVRETTQRAVVEAKRAAQAIRAETEALQDAAQETLSRLAAAADAARAASEESQAAADRHASSIEKRLALLAQTAKAAAKPVQRAEQVQQRETVRVQAKAVAAPVEAPVEEESLYAVAAAAVSRGAAVAKSAPPAQQGERVMGGLKGFGGWTNMFATPEQRERAPAPAPTQIVPEAADAFSLVEFSSSRKDPDAVLKDDAIALVRAAGVDLSRAFHASDLDRIAQSSREGASARRRAVMEAAPGAVQRVSRHIRRDGDAKLVAGEFRSRPDLAKGDKSAQGSDLVRAYLLIDTALA